MSPIISNPNLVCTSIEMLTNAQNERIPLVGECMWSEV